MLASHSKLTPYGNEAFDKQVRIELISAAYRRHHSSAKSVRPY